jgi:hypothetical protein
MFEGEFTIRPLLFKLSKINLPRLTAPIDINKDAVAGQSATIRFGRGRRPRGPTYARGTIRSLFEDQEQATQRTAYDVATRPPCRNLFWGRSFRNNSVCLCRQSIHFEFIGSGFIFCLSFHFQFCFQFCFQFHFRFSFFPVAFHLQSIL